MENFKKMGLGSYCYRYRIGTAWQKEGSRLTVMDFLSEVKKLGYKRALVCENLCYSTLPDDALTAVREMADTNGIVLEVGFRDITAANVLRHIEIAEIWGSDFLRAVCGKPSRFPDENVKEMKKRIVAALKETAPELEKRNMFMGIENHFDLPSDDLVNIVESVNSPNIGMILDTTNGLGFIERIEETLSKVSPHLLSIHLKDYKVEKQEAGYLIQGTGLGEGLMDFESVMHQALLKAPEASVILELSLLKPNSLSDEEVLLWEQEQIEHSTGVLRKAAAKIINKEGTYV